MKKEKKKKGAFGIAKMFLLALLFGVFFFSAFQIISILREDKQSEEAYSNLREEASQPTGSDSGDINSPGTDPSGQNLTSQDGAEKTQADKEKDVNSAGKKEKNRNSSVDIAGLKKKYPELQGWILADGIGIDYPVMQADNNEYYLNHLYDGSQNASGSLFIDYRNSGILTDDNTVIYGHNMDNGAMFAHLNEYKSQEFYEKNPTMVITTEEGDFEVELISGTVEDGDYQFVKLDFDDFDDMKAYTDKIRERSTFDSTVKLEPGDKLISLCTCSYESKNARYMLIGVCR